MMYPRSSLAESSSESCVPTEMPALMACLLGVDLGLYSSDLTSRTEGPCIAGAVEKGDVDNNLPWTLAPAAGEGGGST